MRWFFRFGLFVVHFLCACLQLSGRDAYFVADAEVAYSGLLVESSAGAVIAQLNSSGSSTGTRFVLTIIERQQRSTRQLRSVGLGDGFESGARFYVEELINNGRRQLFIVLRRRVELTYVFDWTGKELRELTWDNSGPFRYDIIPELSTGRHCILETRPARELPAYAIEHGDYYRINNRIAQRILRWNGERFVGSGKKYAMTSIR